MGGETLMGRIVWLIRISSCCFCFIFKHPLERVAKGHVSKAKINMWHGDFTETRAWFVHLWTSVRCDLSPIVNVTRDCFISVRENLKISLKPFMQEKRFKFSLLFTLCVSFSNNRTWNGISIPPLFASLLKNRWNLTGWSGVQPIITLFCSSN